jgi:ribonuclease P protein component
VRLTSTRSFKRVFANPRRFGGTGFAVLARTSQVGHARVGLAISKRCAARAVDRNRLKRTVRESFRTVAERLPPVDVVILCGRGAVTMPAAQLRRSLDEVWRQIGKTPWIDY